MRKAWKIIKRVFAVFLVLVAVHRFLYVVANSNAMNGVDRDTQVLNVKAGWQKLIPILVIVIILMDVGVAFAAYGLWGRRSTCSGSRREKRGRKPQKGDR